MKSSYPPSIRLHNLLRISYILVFLVMIDTFLVVFYSFTTSELATKILLYSAEIMIMLVFAYLLVKSFRLKLPIFIYLFALYLLLIALVSFFFHDNYSVARDFRRYIASLVPLLLGCHFSSVFQDKKPVVIRNIIFFITLLSIISLVEWMLFFFSYETIVDFYSKYFKVGYYFANIKNTSQMVEDGLLNAALRRGGYFIPGMIKRATGFYLEAYSAGFNAAIAVILVLYSKVARFEIKWNNIFIIINLAAMILSTTRSAYLLLGVFLISYLLVQRKFNLWYIFLFIPFFYTSFRDYFIHGITNLGGGPHKVAIVSLPGFLLDNICTFRGLAGFGFGSFKSYTDAGAIKEIFMQLGLFGLISFLILYAIIMSKIRKTRENIFFIIGSGVSIFLLSVYSGRIFGYKSLGLIHFFLGYFMVTKKYFYNKNEIRNNKL